MLSIFMSWLDLVVWGIRVVFGLRCLTEFFHYLVHIVQIKLLINYDNVEGYFNSKRKLEIILARMGCGSIFMRWLDLVVWGIRVVFELRWLVQYFSLPGTYCSD